MSNTTSVKVNLAFKPYLEELESKLQQLMGMKPAKVASLPQKMPEAGVYVFFEKKEALYAGRSNRIRGRLREHIRKNANVAPFAFRLARQQTGYTEATYQKKGSRNDLLSKPEFEEEFTRAIARIGAMEIRYVEEKDPVRQTLLEIYVAVVLGTKFNDFSTH